LPICNALFDTGPQVFLHVRNFLTVSLKTSKFRYCEGGTTETIHLLDSESGIASLPLAMMYEFLEMPLRHNLISIENELKILSSVARYFEFVKNFIGEKNLDLDYSQRKFLPIHAYPENCFIPRTLVLHLIPSRPCLHYPSTCSRCIRSTNG
jgi:hypothetical protein